METTNQTKVQWAVEVFEKNGISTKLNSQNKIIISHYKQPKGSSFEEQGINEDELIENVVACEGVFDFLRSKLTQFPLIVANEIKMYDDTQVIQMSNLKVVNIFVAGKNLKKLPKLKSVNNASFVDSQVNSLPKLQEAGLLVFQNSSLKDLPSLETAKKLCIIDCKLEELKELTKVDDLFICSSNPDEPVAIASLPKLEEAQKIFIANSMLKTMPQLKKAQKIALYNCRVNSVKQSVCKDVEIEKQINDEQLNEKFDTFTNWYSSDILGNSMDLLGDLVNRIKG